MELKKAQELSDILKDLRIFEQDLLVLSEQVKEFKTVRFDGEDGAEHSNYIKFGFERGSNDVIRCNIAKELHKKAIELVSIELKKIEQRIENFN